MSNQNKSDKAKQEEATLQFWQDNNIFEKTLKKDAPQGEFVFYDGPPFATGTPHFGHILQGTIKDAIPRFRTMQGYHVERQWGWDTHGLPLENEVEDKLGLETKKDIAEYGIQKFNEEAKDFVLQYADEWKEMIPRTGRWVDMSDPYRTMDSDYTESIWWAFSELDEKGHIYEGFKAMQICPRCETPLSNFEVNQGYHEQKDIAVTVKLPLVDEPDTSLLVWTTTPWTLPGNMAVAVNPELDYVKVKRFTGEWNDNGEAVHDKVILAKEIYKNIKENPKSKKAKPFHFGFAGTAREDGDELPGVTKIVDEFSGEELVGKSYEPPFDYFADKEIDGKEQAWQIYAGDFVTLEEGTGLVHLAPAFGADDLAMAEDHGIPIVHHVTESGHFTDAVTDFAGMKVKPRDEGGEEHLNADIEILKYLFDKELVFAKENIHHQYPLCWRCDTPLLNYATTSWFVGVSEFKDKLVEKNREVGWVPEAIGSNRFGNWLEGARDWAISRERFWGAPLPAWKSADGEVVEMIGSLDELKEKTKSSNTYFGLRHGEAESNLEGIINATGDNHDSLTEAGKKEVEVAAQELKDVGVTKIFTSPISRVQETATLLEEELGDVEVITDKRLTELQVPEEYEGKTWSQYWADNPLEKQLSDDIAGESRGDLKRRVGEFLYEIDRENEDETVVIISHKGTLNMLLAAAAGASSQETKERVGAEDSFETPGELAQFEFTPLPHNRDFELDFHRPYIDEVTWENEDGQKMERIDAVFDCWFESGSMSYASKHYPFADNDFDPESGQGFPADFVAEGLDQTRGWFYSSLVLGVGLFDQSPYENVIVSGLVMAEDGQKMSKSKGNYPPVSEVLGEQGADALRFFLVNSPLVRGENVALSKDEIDEVVKKVIYRITNTYSFLEMYTDADERAAALKEEPNGSNILDAWILARLNELTAEVTAGLENYELDKAARPITDFVDDLSTWYLRRSRDRIRADMGADRDQAITTLLFALEQLSLLLAPFMPFLAEKLYGDITVGEKCESVHLEDWPEVEGIDGIELLANMGAVRKAASHAHDLRSQHELKVRQPLAKLTLQNENLKGQKELLEILADEVNVSEINFDTTLEEPATLDTELTPELKAAGAFRELLRNVQKLRKQAELDPETAITLIVETDEVGKKLIVDNESELKQTATVEEIIYETVTDGAEIAENDFEFSIEIDS